MAFSLELDNRLSKLKNKQLSVVWFTKWQIE